MAKATLHDGSTIDVEVHGSGPALLLPVDPRPVEGEQAGEMRKWGADPALGPSLIDGLGDAFQVIAFDYQGHVMATPKPGTLTPAAIAADMVSVADAAGAERFAYYGYSWLAVSGLQLALRTDRLSALVMGGFPAYGAPYAEMLRVTNATYAMATGQAPQPEKTGETDAAATADTGDTGDTADTGDAADTGDTGDAYDWSSAEVSTTEEQTRQFVTLYEELQGFDDRAVRLSCPRLCFAGSADEIHYDERWGGTHVSIGGTLARHRAELEALGWDVQVLDGLDHMSAMHSATVLPILRPWLARALSVQV
ncbi:alpha/beta hydrolase [Nonomuraea deserti]|uniref:Alpha/beta hydrolase n=1 Tax=Nonomuraea deserti TaxID=1848322 RepID=A0A4V2Y829_9ACTN|nr:alpha/beta hydrolase [Nonomuraea deserti]TDC94265.1 alpha/beta hydrolase [Nonomuraea deserti]